MTFWLCRWHPPRLITITGKLACLCYLRIRDELTVTGVVTRTSPRPDLYTSSIPVHPVQTSGAAPPPRSAWPLSSTRPTAPIALIRPLHPLPTLRCPPHPIRPPCSTMQNDYTASRIPPPSFHSPTPPRTLHPPTAPAAGAMISQLLR